MAEETPESRLSKNVVIAYDGSEHAKNAVKFYAEKLHMPGDHVFLVYSVEVSDVIQQGKVQSGIKLTTGTVSSVTWSCCHVYISRVV